MAIGGKATDVVDESSQPGPLPYLGRYVVVLGVTI